MSDFRPNGKPASAPLLKVFYINRQHFYGALIQSFLQKQEGIAGIDLYTVTGELPPTGSVDVILLDCELYSEVGDYLEQEKNLRCILFLDSPKSPEIATFLLSGITGYLDRSASDQNDLLRALRKVARGDLSLPSGMAETVILNLTHRSSKAQAQRDQSQEQLTERETQVLSLLAKGLSNKEIAQQVYLSVRTVEGHLLNIYQKVGLHSRSQAILWALNQGLSTDFR